MFIMWCGTLPPFTDEVLAPLKDYDAIYAIPLYPHFSSTTTLSSFDALYEEADKTGNPS
jgi:ferrochelatase